MTSNNREWTTETPLPPRKRASSHASVPNFSSAKRRRTSMLLDLEGEADSELGGTSNLTPVAHSVDRFIPIRPKSAIPLNVTPRTKRISRQFGLTDDRVFNFKDKEHQGNIPFGTRDETNTVNLLRRSASSLFNTPPRPRPTSVTENLGKCKQCTLTLDGPGINDDQYACPITWSKRNMIAVACGNDIFYQDFNNRLVFHLCKLQVSNAGRVHAIEWAGEGRENFFASGSTTGVVQVWDAGYQGGAGKFMRMWREDHETGVGGLSWSEDLLAVGSHDGTISLFDVRKKTNARRVSAHKGKVLGVKWSMDGSLFASGDDLGIVHVWDKRAGKQLLDDDTHGPKLRHRGPVKALAWCPWKPDLLATGSIFPEGTIRVWSSSSTKSSPSPLLTLPLNTSVLSLHWSPHCKELLSTHGPSFEPPSLPRKPSSTRLSTPASSSSTTPPSPKTQSTPLTNSIAVHEYPSGKRLLHLTMAHFGPVTHSCLGPDGQSVFTVCPKEETIKMWQVWGKREDVARESAFDKCTIR